MTDPLEPFHLWTKGRPAIDPIESGLGRDPFRLRERPPVERDAYLAGAASGMAAAGRPDLAGALAAAAPPRAAARTEIWTGSGFFDLAAPQGFMIGGIAEIATSLSRLARFNGRGPRFYSVAEHSILCDEMARAEGVPAKFRRAVLMHDAAEAYVGDVTRPLKRMLPGFETIETGVWLAIAERFDLAHGFDWKIYDDRALAVEKREFFPDSPPWGDLPDRGEWQAPRLDPDAAALEFVRRAEALGIR